LLKINLDFLRRKTGASLNIKIELGSLHISPDPNIGLVIKKPNANVFLKHNLNTGI
jgi:hypothetical protein